MGLVRDRLAVLLATGLYLSYIPSQLSSFFRGTKLDGWTQKRRWTGAGFVGTLLGLALAPLLPGDPVRCGAFLAGAAAAACWLCGRAEAVLGERDDPRIVLDEVVGYWMAIAFLPQRWSVWLVGFVLFRILDAVKPPPLRWLERLPGGLGVVADDLGAGLAANAGLRLLLAYVPQFASR